jgi:hypothetical protein
MTSPLFQSAEQDRRIRDELLRMYPTLAEDDPALLDTLDGESDFDQQARAVLRSILIDEALADGVDELMVECRDRKSRLADRAKAKRGALLAALELAGRRKMELPEATLVVRENPRQPVITDEDALPARYWIAADPKLDTRQIGADLRAGQDVPGATLGNGSVSLQIRKG